MGSQARSLIRILAVSGSLQARSGNRVLLETAKARAPDGVEVTLFEGLRDLPPFDLDVESSGAPEPVLAWRGALAGSDGVLVACPEYGFSLPGALKNAIDWVIGSGELEGKVVGVTAAVNTAGRGKGGLGALEGTLRAVSARLVGGSSIVRGPSFDDDVAALVAAIADETRAPKMPDHGLGVPRPRTLVEAWVEAFNRADADTLATFYSGDAVMHHAAEAPVAGRAAIRARLARGFASAKAHRVVENVFEDGDWAIVQWQDGGAAHGCDLFRVIRGQITLQRGY